MNIIQKTYQSKAVLLVAVAALLLILVFVMRQYVTLEVLKANHLALKELYAGHRTLMAVGFMAVYVLQTALSLPGAAILSLAAGAVFGVALGTLYAVAAATTGAVLAFALARSLLRETILARFGARLERLNSELESRGLGYLLFLRLVPLFPFFLVNLAAGITRLPLRIFVLGTFFGIIPGGFAYVNAGASLASVTSLEGIVSPRVVASLTLLGLFALLPALHAKFINRSG